MSLRNIVGGNCQIEREFEYVDARGREKTLLVNIEICVNRSYAGPWREPPEPPSADFIAASYRDDKGTWRDVKSGEWLDGWVAAAFEALDEDDLYAAMGEAY